MARKRKRKLSRPQYCKSHYRYSSEYNRWHEAIIRGQGALAKEADRLWRLRFFVSNPFELKDDRLPAYM